MEAWEYSRIYCYVLYVSPYKINLDQRNTSLLTMEITLFLNQA
jgi:hypothetical protein